MAMHQETIYHLPGIKEEKGERCSPVSLEDDVEASQSTVYFISYLGVIAHLCVCAIRKNPCICTGCFFD